MILSIFYGKFQQEILSIESLSVNKEGDILIYRKSGQQPPARSWNDSFIKLPVEDTLAVVLLTDSGNRLDQWAPAKGGINEK